MTKDELLKTLDQHFQNLMAGNDPAKLAMDVAIEVIQSNDEITDAAFGRAHSLVAEYHNQ